MKMKEAILNGNINGNVVYEHLSHDYSDSLSWEDNHNVRSEAYDNYNIRNITNNITNYVTNSNIINVNNLFDTKIILDDATESSNITLAPKTKSGLVYNRQYRLNIENNKILVKPEEQSQTANLETLTETVYSPCDSYQGKCCLINNIN